jgi:uncharacterized YccA/Bax inhibitor family protein
MTLDGTVQKSFVLATITVVAGALSWRFAANLGALLGLIASLAAFAVCVVCCLEKEWSPVLAPAYALLKGLALGFFSALFERAYHGIILQAVMLTFGTFFALLAAYSTKLIKPSENFKLGIVAATGGICLVYVATLVLGLFGVQVPLIHSSGWIGIAFSAAVVTIAALNLVLDFDFIEDGCESGAPKYLEWYAAFGLLVSLVWLYVEIVRLLAKLRDR